MPSINRQRPTQQSSSGDVWNDIVPVTRMPKKGLKFAVYGQAKTGKTQFACSFPKPMLLIGTEDGTDTVKTTPGVDFKRLQSADQFGQLIDGLAARRMSKSDPTKPYASVGIDTGGGLQDLILKDVTGLAEIPLNRNWGIASQQQWGQVTGQTKEYLARLFALSEVPSIALNVVVIAHERTFGGSQEEGAIEVVSPVVGASLTPQAARWLDGAVDYLCQTFKRRQVITKEVVINKVKKQQNLVTDKIEYCLRTGPHQYFITGFRLAGGRTPPDAIVNPNYDKVKAVIDNIRKEEATK